MGPTCDGRGGREACEEASLFLAACLLGTSPLRLGGRRLCLTSRDWSSIGAGETSCHPSGEVPFDQTLDRTRRDPAEGLERASVPARCERPRDGAPTRS